MRSFPVSLNLVLTTLVSIILVVTVLQNVGELFYIFSSGLAVPRDIALTPMWIKALKDVTIAATVFSSGIFFFHHRPAIRIYDSLFVLTLVLACAFTYVFANPIKLQLIAGIRAFLPCILLILLRGRVAPATMRYTSVALVISVVVMVALQLVELVLMPRWDGPTFFGLNKRNPGFFLVINSAGFFLTLSWVYICWHFPLGAIRNAMLWGVIPLGILLTASATAVFAMIILVFFALYAKLKQRHLLLPLFPLSAIGGFLALAMITQRENVFESPMTRISLLGTFLSDAFLPLQFGAGTNSAVMLKSQIPDAKIVDSTVNSLLYNVGVYGLVAFVAFIVGGMRKRKETLFFLTVVTLFGLTTAIYEIFPMNVLVFMYAAHLSWRDEISVGARL